MILQLASTTARRSPHFLFGWAVSFLLISVLSLISLTSTQAQLPGTVDPSFAPTIRTNGTVVAIATQADGKQIVGGSFSRIGLVTVPSLARLNADGSLDASFTPPASVGTLYNVAVGADGKVFVLFELPTEYSGNYEVLRLNTDGSVDAGFTPITFSGQFSSDELYPFILAPQLDGKLLVSGDFSIDTTSTAATYAIRRYNVDGSRDAAFQLPSTLSVSIVNSMLPLPTGQVLVSGSFDTASSTSFTTYSLIRLNADGSRDGSYPADPSQVGPGYDLTLQPDGKLLYLKYSNSDYGEVGGVPRRLNADGSVDASFAPQFSTGATFDSLLLQPDGKVVVGGYTAVIPNQDSSTATEQSGVVRVNADGSMDATFNPVTPLVDDRIAALGLLPDGRVIVGGAFQNFAGALQPGLARLNTNGSDDVAFANTLTNVGEAYAVAVQAGGQPLVADAGTIVNGALASSLFSFNNDASLNTVFAGNLTSSQVYYNTGGSYQTTTPALALQPDGKVLLTGVFQGFAGSYYAGVKRFNADGSVDATFQTFLNYYYTVFKAVAPQADGHIYFAGAYADGYNNGTYPLNRLNADGSLDTTFTPANDPGASSYEGSTILALAVQPDGKVLAAGGFLKPVNGQAQPSVLRFNTDGSLDQSFSTGVFTSTVAGFSGFADALTLQPDGKVLVGGAFTAIGGVPANNLARLNTDGSVDTSFNAGTGPDYVPLSVAVQLNGKIVLGGAFTSINGVPSAGVARLKADGSVDTLFFPGAGTGGTGIVNSVALAPDGSLIVGGTFTTFGGQVRDGIARLAGGEAAAPIITSATTATTQVGQAFAYQIVASNTPSVFSATNLPGGLSLSPSTGLITGTPTAAGTFSLTVSATNPVGTGTVTVVLNVLPPAPQVTLAAPSASAQVGQFFSYQIAASNQPTSYGATGLPAGLSVATATGVISGTPLEVGTFQVTLSAVNPGGAGTAVLALSVAQAVPVATLTATVPTVTTGSGEIGEFTLSLSSAPSNDVVVNLAIKGTAIDGTDYVMLNTTKKIKAGKTSKAIKIKPLGNLEGAGKKTVTLILEPGTGYTVGTTGKVKVKILAAP